MAKILDITPTGVWNDLHKFDVTMDDGAKGTSFAKTSPPWYSVGDEVEYTLNPKGNMKISKGTAPYMGTSAPAHQSVPSKPSSKDEQIARSVIFKGAIDLVCANELAMKDICAFIKTHLPTLLGEDEQSGSTYKDHFSEQNPF
jgi:hypothetical protein